MMYPYGEHMGGWGYALGIIGIVLFWAVLVLAIAAAVRYLDRKRGESFPTRPVRKLRSARERDMTPRSVLGTLPFQGRISSPGYSDT